MASKLWMIGGMCGYRPETGEQEVPRGNPQTQFIRLKQNYVAPRAYFFELVSTLSESMQEVPGNLGKEKWIERAQSLSKEVRLCNILRCPPDDRPHPDIQGPEDTHLRNPRIPGSYVRLGRTYVMHQKPTRETVQAIFYSVVLHQAPVWVCLSSTTDKLSKRCAPYWGRFVTDCAVINSEKTSQILYERRIKYGMHEFSHLHLNGWNDSGSKPHPNLLWKLMELFHACVSDKDEIPFVHCSGGVNRTRFFIIMHAVYEQWLISPSSEINVTKLMLTSLIHRPVVSKQVFDWLEEYIPLMNQWMSKK